MSTGQVCAQDKYKKRHEKLLAAQKERDKGRSPESKAKHIAREKAIREAAKRVKAKLEENPDCEMAVVLFSGPPRKTLPRVRATEKTRKSISDALSGRELSDEHKKNISEAIKLWHAKRKAEREAR